MEFLKSCSTNAQAIGQYDAVAYQAFSVARNPTNPHNSTLDSNPSDHVRAAEAHLRQARHLVVQDASKPWLWLFRPTSVEHLNQNPLQLPVVEGYQFHREQYGYMKASELARPPMRSASQAPASTGSMNSPMTPVPAKAMHTGGGRLQQGSLQSGSTPEQQQQDVFAVYELFTSSVVALILYSLVKDHQVIALNNRTFVSRSNSSRESETAQSRLEPEPLSSMRLTNVDVFWASSGTVVVSTFTLPQPDMHCVDDVPAKEQKDLPGRCIRVAPNGILAQIVSFENPLEVVVNERNHKGQRKRSRISPLEQGIERWKSAVRRWLAWKGYSIPNLDMSSSWVRVRITQPNQHAISSPATSNPSKEILWPQALCFFYVTDNETRQISLAQGLASGHGDDVFKWFEAPNSAGYIDPIDAAQRWFMGKAERDKIVEARRKVKKAEQDAVRSKEDIHTLLPSSPLNSRSGAYGDLQAVSGVYPTPPDGIPPGTVLSSADTPGVAGVGVNVILPPGGTNPAINLSAPQDMIQLDGQQQPPTSPDFALTFDQFNPAGNHDDLFEDMEEDGFEANGVTDADFNFFDEPDDEDVDMLDGSNSQDTKQSAKKKTEKLKASIAPSGSVVKDQAIDHMVALERALNTASDKSESAVQETKPTIPTGMKTTKKVENVASSSRRIQEVQDIAIVPHAKEPTPPLSPHFIEEALLPSMAMKPTSKSPVSAKNHRKNSAFDPLDFSRKMSISDAKYQAGRFNFPMDKVHRRMSETEDTTHQPKSLRDLPLLTKLRYAIGVAANKGLPDMPSPTDVESDSSDSISDTSSVEDDVDEPALFAPSSVPSGITMPVKRKLPTEGNATPLSATSYADSFGGDYLDMLGLQTDESALTALEPTFFDWPLVHAPPPTEISSTQTRYSVPSFSPLILSTPSTPISPPDISMDMLDEKPLGGKDSIAVAQIVIDQIVSATLDVLHEPPNHGPDDFSHHIPSEALWHEAIKTVFPNATDCNVTALAAVQDVFPDYPPNKGQQRPLPRKPNEGPAVLSHQMHQINPPYIRVRRSDVMWDLLPPAVAFWEPLGLSPCNPPKNVVAFAIYPYSESLKLCVNNFMVNIQLAYDNCRLGSHARVETVQEYEGGLVPCKISNWTSTRAVFKALRDTCIQLGKLLAMKHAQMRDKDDTKIDAFVIYMIDPFENSSALWELCSAFWMLFQSYGQGPPGRHDQIQRPDLVLQVVPIKYVASFEAPVILDSGTYASLAREVYDRCPPSSPCEDKTPLSIYTAPSFQLEEPIPRSIPFKLNAEAPHDLLHENSYIHLGYAISLDGMWVTAAWTDTCGKFQAVVSYSLATRAFGDIAKEMWQTTIEIMQARRVTWRVCIAKAGVMDREELDAWVFLVSCPTQVNMFISLLTVDTEPHLKFTPPIPSNPPGANANTPGSTPQAVVSPDHGLTPAATPSAEPAPDPTTDPEARLVDATDETWGIVLAHRLHNSHATNEFRPALISGLIIKRGLSPSTPVPAPYTPDTTPGPAIVAVNILWMGAVNPTRAATSPFPAAATDGISPGGGGIGGSPAQPSPLPQERSHSLTWTPTAQTRAAAENLLKEILGQFRGLGLLGRLRGIRGTKGGAVPWHVAVCVRGAEGLRKVVPAPSVA